MERITGSGGPVGVLSCGVFSLLSINSPGILFAVGSAPAKVIDTPV